MSEKLSPDTHEQMRSAEHEAHPTAEKSHQLEKGTESQKPLQESEVRREVEEALKTEHASEHAEKSSPAPQSYRSPSLQNKKMVYKSLMRKTQQNMSTPSRAFSKFIHNSAVETSSEVVGRTIARPNSILLGSMGSFIIVLAIYLLAKNKGYRLSGSEFILVFVIGWFVGLLMDFLRNMITGGRTR